MTAPDERAIRQRLKDDLVHYSQKCLKIRTKSGVIEPFVFNRAQSYIHSLLQKQLGETSKVRAIILKGRQQGCSTYVGARFYHKVSHNYGLQAFILAHALDATQNLYKMAQRFYHNTPVLVKPEVSTSNAKELLFGTLDSGYKLGTAENKEVGRSATIQLLHGSEVAFWNNAAEHAKGIMQAVPNAVGTEIILESTANGIGNYYHQQWQSAESGDSEYIAIFVPWYWQEEYIAPVPEDFEMSVEESELTELYGLSPQQLVWRRQKITELAISGHNGEIAFQIEYPNTPTEAFIMSDTAVYIQGDMAMRARKCTTAERYGKLVVGVDPARFGDDRSCIIRRQGRVAYGLESYKKIDTMHLVGIVHRLIAEESPYKVFVDIGGLGAGIVDRLFELGHRDVVVGINAGGSPLDSRRYANKRCEMWGELKKWLADEPVSIPDSDALHADICGIQYKIDSNSRLVMERKEDMKKRGIRSPDCFVAGTLIRTPNGHIPIEQLCEGDIVCTPFGDTPIIKHWHSSTERLTTVNFSNGLKLKGKGEHKVFNWKTGICTLDALQLTFDVEIYSRWRKLKWMLLKPLLTKEKNSEFKPLVDTINRTGEMSRTGFFTVAFGQITTGIYQKIMISITKMVIGETMKFQTSSPLIEQNIDENICWRNSKILNTGIETKKHLKKLIIWLRSGMDQTKESNGIKNMAKHVGTIANPVKSYAQSVIKYSKHFLMRNSALSRAVKKDVMPDKKHSLKYALGVIKNFWLTNIATWNVVPSSVQTEDVCTTSVYNLTLEKHNAYYANDILVFNCADALCLTFSYPTSATEFVSKNSATATKIMSSFERVRKLKAVAYGKDKMR